MNEQSRMLVRAATGPIILITVGTLFALEKFTPYRFGQTWPVLLIIIGILKLMGGGGSRRGRRCRTPFPAASSPTSRGASSPGPNPFPPIPPQPSGSDWKKPDWRTPGNMPPRPATPPYTHAGEQMPDMTPPPPPRPGERR